MGGDSGGASNEAGNRLSRMIRRSSGSVLTARRAQIVLLAAQWMPPAKVAGVVDAVTTRVGFGGTYPTLDLIL